MNPTEIIDQIFATFHANGGRDYGEQVTELEHALQAALAAEQDNAGDILVAAALLHDYGHLIHGLPEDIADQSIDGMHEEVGAVYLTRWFGPEITEPIRLHVASKRYLCAVEPEYLATLSEASLKSLELQGGSFSKDEVQAFEAGPFYNNAVRLRRYDDIAKIPGLPTPELEHYRPVLEAALKP